VRTAILALSLLTGACHFTVDGVVPIAPVTAPDDAFTPPDPVDLSMSSSNPDGAVPPDLLTADLTPAPPDLTPPPVFNIGDACVGNCGGLLTCMTWVTNGYCSQSCNGSITCPTGSSCVDIGGGGGSRYCLLNAGGGCSRSDLKCRDCGSNVCAPSGFCSGC
jgi:hypothetical protein